MNQDLHRWGYRPHCSYSTKDGATLICHISLDLVCPLYAFELNGKILASKIEGKSEANQYFKDHLLPSVNLSTKKVLPRKHIYYIHYHIGDRNQDMVCMKTGDSKEQIEADWLKAYKFAILNHGYQLQKIEEIY